MLNTSQAAGCLPAPPPAVTAAGRLCAGRFAGRIDRIDWTALSEAQARSAWWRRLHHKRWQYVGLGSARWFIGLAIVDLGWCVTAFAYVFDRAQRRVVVDWAQDGLPGWSGEVADAPVCGGHARFRGWRAHLSVTHQLGDALAVQVRVPGLHLAVTLGLAQVPPFLLAIGPVAGGVAHATQKSPGLPVQGWMTLKGVRHELSQAVATLDSSNGLLAHETAWRWACAHDRRVGFNLQEGYFGQHENVLWLDGALWPLGAAHFDFQAGQVLAPWRIWTDDGLLDLRFHPEGARQAHRDLGVVASAYVQPVGTFQGWVRAHPQAPRVPVDGLLGVTEDHRSRW